MVAAAKDLVLILVDCTDRSNTPEPAKTHNVRGLPTLLFMDPDGKVVGNLTERSADGIVRQFGEIVDKHRRKIPWAETIEKAIEAGKEGKKPVLLLVTDDEEDSKKVEAFFFDPATKEALDQFVLVRHAVEKKCETCKKYRATKGGKILLLDPTAEDPAKSPLAKVSGKKKAEDLAKALLSARKRWDKKQEKEAK